MRFLNALSGLPALLTLASAAQLTQIPNFGDNSTNPRGVGFYIYVPDTLATNPPILVNPHWCHGTAQDAYAGTQYARLADTYGFIIIYPDSPNLEDHCWDVSSAETLSHNGGGDSLGIVSMVRWTLEQYNADASRVFVTGTSSGAMMTNVLIGAYPDVFAAGTAMAGVAFGCYAGPGYDVWSDDCATGKIQHTGAEWAAIVQAAYPEYTGWRPKLQVMHGTVDEILNYQNFQEEIKEWTAVLGYSETPVSITDDTPLANWTKYTYGDKFEAFSALNVPHNIPHQEATVMAWFDLTCTTGDCFSRPKVVHY